MDTYNIRKLKLKITYGGPTMSFTCFWVTESETAPLKFTTSSFTNKPI